MLSMLPEDERHQSLVNWNSTEVVFPEEARRLDEPMQSEVAKSPII